MSTFPPPTTAPAGWYPDPTNGGTRYFDGRVWAPIQPVFEEREAHPASAARRPRWARSGCWSASLLVGRTLGALVADVGPDVIGFAVAVAIGYGPSVMWAWYVMRRHCNKCRVPIRWFRRVKYSCSARKKKPKQSGIRCTALQF